MSVEPHNQPPHKHGWFHGHDPKTGEARTYEIWSKTCPSCHQEVLALLHEFKDGKVIRTFCHLCPEPKTDDNMGLMR